MSFSLPTTDEKAEYVLRQFDRIASRYDLTNDAISMGMHHFWKQQAVHELGLQPGGRYLDVCCGTGDLTLRIARALGDHGQVVGLDFSSNMLAVAQRRLNKTAPRIKVEFVQADALTLPFEDATFDGAIVSFGLRNLVDYQKGINEMTRVVKPGGSVINLDLGRSKVPFFAPIFALYFRHVVPMIGQLLQSDKQAYTYLPESLSTYPDVQGVSNIFSQAGLLKVKHVGLAFGTVALHKGTVSGGAAS